jgi:benzoate/toluate 1,2-dioxygenase beta subunit
MDSIATVPLDSADVDLRTIEVFLQDEANLLDQGRFEDWMALFTPDGYYWVPVVPDQQSFLDHVSLFYDDRPMMEARILRLRHPRNQANIPPGRALRMVGHVRLDQGNSAPGQWRVRSKLVMVEARRGEKRIFAGDVEHDLRLIDGALRIGWKKVVLVDCDQPFEELMVPF